MVAEEARQGREQGIDVGALQKKQSDTLLVAAKGDGKAQREAKLALGFPF